MREEIFNGETVASKWVRQAVIVGLWAPVVITLIGVSVTVAVGAVRLAMNYDPTAVSVQLPSIAQSDVAIAAIFGAIAYLYILLSTATFGSGTVQEASEQAEQLEVNKAGDDDVN